MINIEVEKGANENNLSLLRRFTKRVQGAGILNRVRSMRYSARAISENVKQKKTLKLLRRRLEVAQLIKLGKLIEEKNVRARKK